MTEMWELYRVLGRKSDSKYVLDEISYILQHIEPYIIKQSLFKLYKSPKIENPLEVGLMFTKGLKDNRFFDFQYFIESINGNSK